MPELPEVETTLRGITPHLINQTIQQIIIRNSQLRWLIPIDIQRELPGQKIKALQRRGKYLLLDCTVGTLLVHLGMSGSLKILSTKTIADKHDHVDIIFSNHIYLRFTDPRRFGCILWTHDNPLLHPLLKNLGPEPLSALFTAKYLYQRSRKCSTPIKNFLMNSKIVVGVGNIYANEALFLAGIHPLKPANSIYLESYAKLIKTIKQVLRSAIKQGGTTLRNFINSDGKPGYFKQQLKVYGRGGMSCLVCKTKLQEIRLGQRSTVYCPKCQQS